MHHTQPEWQMYPAVQPVSPGEHTRWFIEPMIELGAQLREITAWTWTHSGRVARYAVAFGKKLGLDPETTLALHCAALLHDVGKITIPTDLLDKSTKLTRDEWYMITKHSMASSLMLRALQVPVRVISIAQSHHEWYNGQGYPLGLEAEAIPLGARILSLADAYEAMSSDRPYRPSLPPERIAEEIEKGAGTQFDPNLVRALLPLIQAGPANLTPARTLRVISDDSTLYRQLWFASYPLGWQMHVWPPAWAPNCPPDLLEADTHPVAAQPDLTVVDGRSARRAPEGFKDHLGDNTLWIDPIAGEQPATYRPLDLKALIPPLDFDLARRPPPAAHDPVPIRVLIADPYQLFRQALKLCLDACPDVEVVSVVRSPGEYREVQSKLNFQVAIVASDLFEGTRSTVPLGPGDYLLRQSDAGANSGKQHPIVVLVADADLDPDSSVPRQAIASLPEHSLCVPRHAPAEMLVDAMKTLLAEEEQPGSEE